MKKITNLLRNAHPTFVELLLGILLWGVLLGAIFTCVTASGVSFVISWLTGMAGAAAMAGHMYASAEQALEIPAEDASGFMRRRSMMRYVLVILLILAVYYLKGNVVAVFGGLLTLKLSAYVQPLVHKYLGTKIFRKEERR